MQHYSEIPIWLYYSQPGESGYDIYEGTLLESANFLINLLSQLGLSVSELEKLEEAADSATHINPAANEWDQLIKMSAAKAAQHTARMWADIFWLENHGSYEPKTTLELVDIEAVKHDLLENNVQAAYVAFLLNFTEANPDSTILVVPDGLLPL